MAQIQRTQQKMDERPQKVKWTKVAIYDTYVDADEKRNSLNEEGKLTKIRRCGPRGLRFKVLTGQPIEKPKEKKKGSKR